MEYSGKLQTIKLSQNIGSFFLTKMTPSLLNKIKNKNLSVYKDEINGIQRNKDERKVKEIQKYLKEDRSASFPNTVIIAIRDDLNVEAPLFTFDEQENLYIALEPDIANIIDGQHRLAGFDEDDDKFELPVAVFINLPLGEQAKLFAKINSTQTKVNLDIVYENFFKSNQRSREKTSFFIVKTLNEKESSPWFGKIKTLSDRGGDLAQGSMAKYIDKYLLDVGKPLHKYFAEGNDQFVFDLLFNYFSAVREVFPEPWNNSDAVYILTKTAGFNGLMSFLVTLLKLEENKGSISALGISDFRNRFLSVEKEFLPFTNKNYPSGVIGQNLIRDTLRKSLSEEEKSLIGLK